MNELQLQQLAQEAKARLLNNEPVSSGLVAVTVAEGGCGFVVHARGLRYFVSKVDDAVLAFIQELARF